ncbi:DedA family protein [Pseudoroseicyclus sp. H15]
MFDWITGIIDSMGLVGVALLMFLENVFPPIPSELIMPLAGFNAARGEMSLPLIIIAGSVGSLAGAYLWYWLAQKLGRDRLRRFSERHGRWTGITPEDFDKAEAWFDRHGGGAVLIGRLIPTVRTFISVPAGLTDMPLSKFLAFSAVGTVAWTTILAMLGYWLESGYEAVQGWLDPVTWVVIAGIVGFYIYQVATYDRRRAKAKSAS